MFLISQVFICKNIVHSYVGDPGDCIPVYTMVAELAIIVVWYVMNQWEYS